MNIAIILAGGKGERLEGYSIPKQYIEVGGKTIISYVLEVFKKSNDIDIICIVAEDKWHDIIGDYIYAEPGVSRQHSIYNGLLAVESFNPSRVVVHDAARPIITLDDISRCLNECEDFDGGTPCFPVVETIYKSSDGNIMSSTLNRDELFVGQTPECYDYKKYLEAHRTFEERLGAFRGSSEIAIMADMKIKITTGNPNNFKITTRKQLEKFQSMVGGGYYEGLDIK